METPFDAPFAFFLPKGDWMVIFRTTMEVACRGQQRPQELVSLNDYMETNFLLPLHPHLHSIPTNGLYKWKINFSPICKFIAASFNTFQGTTRLTLTFLLFAPSKVYQSMKYNMQTLNHLTMCNPQ